MSLDQDGYQIVPDVLDRPALQPLKASLNHSGQAGIRGIANLPALSKLVTSEVVRGLLPSSDLQLVRSILFDKSPEANWPVAWHQDRTITVEDKHEVVGYGPWTRKKDVYHVEPPARLLERMTTIRLHLDDTPSENGALKVIPKSHRHGKLDPEQVEEWKKQPQRSLVCAEGDAILMRPLLLHSSPRALTPSHRRVLHFEFAPLDQLSAPLRWKRL